jgi:nucleoside-diphosphate-sugar epimerase
MSLAIDWAINRNNQPFLICNTGSNNWNYTVKQLAEKVQEQFKDVSVSVNTEAPPDKRSYRVNFDLFSSLAGKYNPQYDIQTTVKELIEGMNAISFSDAAFRTSPLMRLNVLNTYLDHNQLDANLSWKQL